MGRIPFGLQFQRTFWTALLGAMVVACGSEPGEDRSVMVGSVPDALQRKELPIAKHDPAQGESTQQFVIRMKLRGPLACDGYMTRNADQNYCAAMAPDDWEPFTFNGQQFFVQPL